MTANEKTMFVRHVHTGEIKQVTHEQREVQDKNFWVRVTGDDVKVTAPETAPSAAPDAAGEPADPDGDNPKTASKATPPKK